MCTACHVLLENVVLDGAAQLEIAQGRMQMLTASLNQARQNAENYVMILGEIQGRTGLSHLNSIFVKI